jgi:hypothetical protein
MIYSEFEVFIYDILIKSEAYSYHCLIITKLESRHAIGTVLEFKSLNSLTNEEKDTLIPFAKPRNTNNNNNNNNTNNDNNNNDQKPRRQELLKRKFDVDDKETQQQKT